MSTLRFCVLVLVGAWCAQLSAQEVCDNGIDDDGNGLVDLNDAAACHCPEEISTEHPIPNAQFEDTYCLPWEVVQFACATDWYAAIGTPDFMWNDDYWIPWVPAPPSGNGVVGGHVNVQYSEHPGTCLITPLLAGTAYTFSTWICGRSRDNYVQQAPLLPAVDITLWGMPTCPTWTDQADTLCPAQVGWVPLGVIPYVPDTTWSQVSMSFIAPFSVQAIAIGAPCNIPDEYQWPTYGNSPYVLYDDLSLSTPGLTGTLVRTGAWCTNDMVLHAWADTVGAHFQWYHEGVALVGRTESLLALSTQGLPPGTYQVRISVGERCILRTINVPPDPPLEAQFTATPVNGCSPLTVTFANTSTASAIQQVLWNFGDGASSLETAPIHTYTGTGLFNVGLVITDTSGCSAQVTVSELITVFPRPTASFVFAPQPANVNDPEITFNSTSSADVVAWSWHFMNGTPGSDVSTGPTVRFPGDSAGRYDVILAVRNDHGCVDTAHATVVVEGRFSLYAPNAFTPTGDGVNDGWRPIWRDLDPTAYDLRIFDRWGREVWACSDAWATWDGTVNGAQVPNDIYVWKLEVRDINTQERLRLFGHVTVLR
jgi:gliding motility-associated-like protein